MTVSSAPEVIEGTWDEICRQESRFNGHRLRVTILSEEESKPAAGQQIWKGMFPQLAGLTEEDFKSAEYVDVPEEESDRA